jgi:hypothetical protein
MTNTAITVSIKQAPANIAKEKRYSEKKAQRHHESNPADCV